MLAYKALYSKMMDDLKDAGMWIEWAEQIRASQPKVAEYLVDCAKERLENDFPKTYECFEEMCEGQDSKGSICVNKVIHDHIMDWRHSMLHKAEDLEKEMDK